MRWRSFPNLHPSCSNHLRFGGIEPSAAKVLSVHLLGYFLAVAMAGVGLGTDIGKLRQLGAKPFYVGLFAALSVGVVSVILIKILAPFLATVK